MIEKDHLGLYYASALCFLLSCFLLSFVFISLFLSFSPSSENLFFFFLVSCLSVFLLLLLFKKKGGGGGGGGGAGFKSVIHQPNTIKFLLLLLFHSFLSSSLFVFGHNTICFLDISCHTAGQPTT